MPGTIKEDELTKFCHRAERERTTEAQRARRRDMERERDDG
jgi:hypothetical protein